MVGVLSISFKRKSRIDFILSIRCEYVLVYWISNAYMTYFIKDLVRLPFAF